ncbi:MAG: hypothetical protein Aureis2KO_17130 [Aureisphaera sp.]
MAFILQGTAMSYAQVQKEADEIALEQTGLMTEKLGLSEAQEIQVHALNKLYAEKEINLMNESGSKFSKVGRLKDMNKSKAQKFQSILSEEQMKLYKDEVIPILKEQIRSRFKS